MEILDTIVRREISAISNSSMKSPAHLWKLVIKANGREFKPTYVRDVKLDRLYHLNYADEIRITAGFLFGDYSDGILPYRSQLEAVLISIPMAGGVNPEISENKSQASKTFKVTLTQSGSDAISGDNPLTVAKNRSNSGHIVDVEMQLYSPVIDRIKKKTFGTSFRDTNPIDAIAYVLLTQSNDDGAVANSESTATVGINIDETFQPIERKHIVVDHDLKIPDIPMHIDDMVGGTHPAQMRHYLQAGFWHIYPIYDHTRWGKNIPSLTIIKIPKHRLQNIDKTYRVEGNQVIILTTKETRHTDKSEEAQLNEGNGTRFADARAVMNGYVQVGDNKAYVDATQNMTEVLYEEREDGSNFVTGGGAKITDKYNKEYAKLAYTSGAHIQTMWENSDPEILYPGMPVRYIFQDGEETKELYGTLNAVETLDYNTTNTVSEPRFVTLSLLTIFVSRKSPLEDSTVMSVSQRNATSDA